jgi:2-polyprenyl-3-methyl-5-hydroxy-6-metoxy-1,4-benzoquinol methylase
MSSGRRMTRADMSRTRAGSPVNPTPSDLVDRRREAAVASGGHSNEHLYAAFLRELENREDLGDVLDFGAGTGTLTQRLLATGRVRSMTGADIMGRPPGLAENVKWISGDLNNPLAARHEEFDLVIAAEVVEHLENSRAVAREWFRILRPGGQLVLSTPNNESWRALLALLFRGHFVFFGDGSYPAHITALVRQDIERILTEAGFERPRFVFPDNGVVPKLTRLTWQQISAGLLSGLRYSDNLLAMTIKPRT